MSSRYLIPAAVCRVEESIKRSRFIATAAPAPDGDTVKAFIAERKAEFPDATHNCWAYLAGPPGDTACVGLSDDGEPHGTAGKPMLNVLLHSGIGEVAVVVTRYYGGTKLGTGGLVRAYASLTKAVLDRLETRERVESVTLSATIPYAAVTPFKRMLPDFEIEVMDETFTAEAGFTLWLPAEHEKGFRARLVELTDGRAIIMKK